MILLHQGCLPCTGLFHSFCRPEIAEGKFYQQRYRQTRHQVMECITLFYVFVTNSTEYSAVGPHFYLVFVLLMYPWKPFLLPFTSLISFKSRQALAFLTPSLHVRGFLLVHPTLLQPLAYFLFMSEFSQELLAHPYRPTATFPW